MATRTLSMIAAIGLVAAFSAHADPGGGDIVDQILRTVPPRPAGSMPANPVVALPASAAVAPADSGGPSDPPPMPVNTTWRGFYLGGNLGEGWTRGGNGSSCINSVTGNSTGCDVVGDGALNTSGFFGGGQLGYLAPLNLGWRLPLMVGVEGDMQGASMSGSQNVAGPFPLVGFPATCSPCSFNATQQLDWFGTLRARVGVPFDGVLVYGTGGVMFGAVKASQNLNFNGSSEGNVVSAKSTLSGPTIGGGVEFLLPGPWSAKVEALYYDMGTLKTVAVPVNGAPANFSDAKSFGFQGTIVRVGVNLRLGDIFGRGF